MKDRVLEQRSWIGGVLLQGVVVLQEWSSFAGQLEVFGGDSAKPD